MARPKILVLHGPNLGLLGEREVELYGSRTLAQINAELVALGEGRGYDVAALQSNHEGVLIDAIQEARGQVVGLLVNAGGYTHTSVALRDALLASRVPVVEVHLTNIYRREPFRRVSLLSDVAVGVVAGFGADSYVLGLNALINHVERGGAPQGHPVHPPGKS